MQTRPWGDDAALELKIIQIDLLPDIKDKMLKHFTLTIPVQKINSAFNKQLDAFLSAQKGTTPLKINSIDPVRDFRVPMFSKKYKINVSEEALQFFESQNIEVKVN